MMEHQFDALAKSLAATVSRREAIRRLGGGLAGAVLASLGSGRAWSAPAPNSHCEDFCRSKCGIHPGGGNAFGKCVSSCEACVNRTGGQLPCLCPASPGGDVVCCTGGQTCCSGICKDTSTDSNNCGACGHACTGYRVVCCSGTCSGEQNAPCVTELGLLPWADVQKHRGNPLLRSHVKSLYGAIREGRLKDDRRQAGREFSRRFSPRGFW